MKTVLAALAALSALALAAPTHAGNLVVNGGFEATNGLTGSAKMSTTNVSDWSTTGYNFIYFSGTGDVKTNAPNGVYMWGPNNTTPSNGFTASSPDGGNFIAADGDYNTKEISQTIHNLTPGDKYTIGFDEAFAQQHGFNGDTIQHWTVSLGTQIQSTADYDLSSHAFSGWMHEKLVFTATSATEVLSFLAYGNKPVPPFALLDGVTFYQGVGVVPEPATWALMLMGVAGLGGVSRRRRAAVVAA
jgi:hypothetical protein